MPRSGMLQYQATAEKKAATGRVTLEERPSTPSVMFTAFTVPTMTKAAKTM